MEVYDAVRSLLTVRRFKPDPVPEDVVTRILRAGRWAPSSQNSQRWHFIVIRDRERLESIGSVATSGSFVAQAPLAIAVVMDNAERPDLDAGRALQQMELVAWSEGLGTCFVGLRLANQNEKVKEILGVPAAMELITVLPFGYRPDQVKGAGKRRKPLTEIVHRERFGTKE